MDGADQAEWIAYMYLGTLQSELIDFSSARCRTRSLARTTWCPRDHWGDPPGGLRWDGTPQPGAP